MLAIDVKGAWDLVALLKCARRGETIDDTQLHEVLNSNAFFVDFYSRWEGLDRQTIADAVERELK